MYEREQVVTKVYVDRRAIDTLSFELHFHMVVTIN